MLVFLNRRNVGTPVKDRNNGRRNRLSSSLSANEEDTAVADENGLTSDEEISNVSDTEESGSSKDTAEPESSLQAHKRQRHETSRTRIRKTL